ILPFLPKSTLVDVTGLTWKSFFDTVAELGKELENFKKVFQQDLSVVVHSSTLES
ncbi:hypothetical protein CFP56_005998, partial [Quercus suber]